MDTNHDYPSEQSHELLLGDHEAHEKHYNDRNKATIELAELMASDLSQEEFEEYLDNSPALQQEIQLHETITNVISDKRSLIALMKSGKTSQLDTYSQDMADGLVNGIGRKPDLLDIRLFLMNHTLSVADTHSTMSTRVSPEFESAVVNATTSQLLARADLSLLCASSATNDINALRNEANAINTERKQSGKPLVNPDFIVAKAEYLSSAVTNIRSVVAMTEKMPDQYDYAESDIESMREYNAATAKHMQKIRRYGVKPIAFDGSEMFDGIEMIYSDLKGMGVETTYSNNSLAAIRLVDPSRTDAEAKFTRSAREDSVAGGFTFGGTVSFISLDHKGEVYAGLQADLASTPLRPVFESIGKPAAYEQLRAHALSNLFDAIAPPSVLTRFERDNRPVRTSKDPSERAPTNIVTPLLVPRHQYLLQPRRDIQKQFDEANKQEIREQRLHEVTEHLRRIPARSRPSAEAILASKQVYGEEYELPEGYTFVRAHERGDASLGRVVGHMAIKSTKSA